MRSDKENIIYETIAFRTQEQAIETLVDVYATGRERTSSTSYRWDGMRREKEENFVFQYTLQGEGSIDIKGNTYSLLPGQAFMVQVPDEHCYYLPETSEGWEFIFLTLRGQAASTCWEKITSQFGHILQIPLNSNLIQLVMNIYQQACDEDLIDQYYASSQAYAFIMECYRYSKQLRSSGHLPDSVLRAVHYIEMYYQLPLTIEDIANSANLSKYYIIRLFRETLNMTPIQYLQKIRLQQAIHLLRNSDLTIKDIAGKTGYSNDNYFNKVFRKVIGISPGDFRKRKHSIPFDRLVIQ
ncbi:AraC family transcriptional regulator [Halalkalibacter akibai]|uniref:Helix-turn-helix n=1 Tax=Halalkalibacter akibai (strain ATCC 43226 / DSM 21942 / CIP 109018 / JCM 9157 / 1139) TaxID=1236973 RepID=W4QVZ8_HALA3|nr:AraC family transcriptional regulator [Halalkalibacter akibai]GAE36286.1 helix-turn-helix [Halalkalibacter akibai JCM 9157]